MTRFDPASAERVLARGYPHLRVVTAISAHSPKTCLVESDGRQLIFKRHAHWVRDDKITAVAGAMEVLGKAGLGPRVFPDRDGNFLHWNDGSVFSLQEWKPGRPLTSTDAWEVAETLATLHQVLDQATVPETSDHKAAGVYDLSEQAAAYGFREEAEFASRALRDLTALPRQTVHGDTHPGNMLRIENAVLFLDLDSLHTGWPAEEAAFTGFRLLGPDTEPTTEFARRYAASNPHAGLTPEAVGRLALLAIMRRLLFILVERDRGEGRWLDDLDNQTAYARAALELAKDLGGR